MIPDRLSPQRPFRLTPPPEPFEADIQVQCADFLNRWLAPPAVWFPYPAGHIQLAARDAAKLARMGLKRGLPDLWLLYNGVWCIELKRRGGRLSQTRIVRTRRGSPRVLVGQQEMFRRLIDSGAVTAIAICETLEEVIAQLRKWKIPVNGFVG